MKRIIYFILIFHFYQLPVKSQKQVITNMYFEQYNDSSNSWVEQKKPYQIFNDFNKNDNLIKISTNNYYGDLPLKLSQTVKTYNEKKLIISEEIINANTDNIPTKLKREWKYNLDDLLIEEKLSRFDYKKEAFQIEYIFKYEYNSLKKKLKTTNYYYSFNLENGKPIENISFIDFKYNSKNNLIEERYSFPNSSDNYLNQIKYDELNRSLEINYFRNTNGQLFLLKSTLIDSTLETKIISNFKENGQILFKIVENYDQKKQLISEKYYLDFDQKQTLKLVSQIDLFYNLNGNVQKKISKHLIPKGWDAFEYSTDTTFREDVFEYTSDNLVKNQLSKIWETNAKSISTKPLLSRIRYEYKTLENKKPLDVSVNYIISPNPATNKIIINNTIANECLNSITLYSTTGQKIDEFKKDKLAPTCRWELSLSPSLQKGMYLLQFQAFDGTVSSKRIMVER